MVCANQKLSIAFNGVKNVVFIVSENIQLSVLVQTKGNFHGAMIPVFVKEDSLYHERLVVSNYSSECQV